MRTCARYYIRVVADRRTTMTKVNVNGSEVEGEDRSMIETILRRCTKDDTIRLDHIECEPGSRLGDNYMSIVKRVRVSGTRATNEAYFRTMIVKRPILRRSRRRLFRCDEAFENEIRAYRRLVPAFNRFISHTGNVLPYPPCMFAGTDQHGDMVVLEDLRESGFRMVDRLKGLDLAHCCLVMRKLGALHGVSFAMKSSAATRFNECQRHVEEIVYCPEAAEFYSSSLNSSVREALSSLRASNRDATLDEPIREIECLTGKMYNVMAEAICNSEDDWKIMCHGDLWINNLMFKYSNGDPTRVEDVKFIDLQTTRFASVAIDILHFIYTSTERDIRQNHMDQLLATYVEAILDEVRLHDLAPADLYRYAEQFTVERLWQEIRSKIMYGLGISMWLLPAVTFHPDRIPNLNAITMSDFTNSNQEKTITQLQTPEYHMRLKDIVMEFHTNEYFREVHDQNKRI